MKRKVEIQLRYLNQQAAAVLLRSVCNFLLRNGIEKKWIAAFTKQKLRPVGSRASNRQFKEIARAYEEMGTVIATWFSEPCFLDKGGQPLPLSVGRGTRTISNLLRISRVNLTVPVAVDLLRRSPSISVESSGKMLPVSRVFILPGFEFLRAGIVIERFLETLQGNASSQDKAIRLLLERSSYVAGIDLRKIAPLLRDIKQRGTAFMDSVDGEFESHRAGKSVGTKIGEIGLFTFAWTRSLSLKSHHNATASRLRK